MTTDHERIRLDYRRHEATKSRRRVKPAQAAADAIARAQQLADRWESAPPRRPMFGHGPDCPNRLAGPMRRCPWCRAEALAGPRVNGVPVPATSALAPAQPAAEPAWRTRLYGPTRETHDPDCPLDPRHHIQTPCVAVSGPPAPIERACAGPGCWRPTDHHSGRCDRCRAEGDTP